jgi:hypothetical protein
MMVIDGTYDGAVLSGTTRRSAKPQTWEFFANQERAVKNVCADSSCTKDNPRPDKASRAIHDVATPRQTSGGKASK